MSLWSLIPEKVSSWWPLSQPTQPQQEIKPTSVALKLITKSKSTQGQIESQQIITKQKDIIKLKEEEVIDVDFESETGSLRRLKYKKKGELNNLIYQIDLGSFFNSSNSSDSKTNSNNANYFNNSLFIHRIILNTLVMTRNNSKQPLGNYWWSIMKNNSKLITYQTNNGNSSNTNSLFINDDFDILEKEKREKLGVLELKPINFKS
ncbi:hypothetical protein K502DRAFT_325879 [Neoconidiobolus thromboides FSU 785]|nr:hypothetical protein K502DRAFT_325879 [Neoconidiobolus thromboides FSU 785]